MLYYFAFKLTTMKSVAFALIILLAAGCSSSRITHSWKNENVSPKSYNRILVIGLLRDADLDLREKMENHLAGDLKMMGYNAVPSLQQYGPTSFRSMGEEKVIDTLTKSGFDAVLTIVMLDKTKERYYVPSRVYYSPYSYYQGRFWGYYATMYDRIYMPGYYASSTRYFWESNLYDMDAKALLYSVQTESFEPASSESMGHEYGQLIVKDMTSKNILAAKRLGF